MKRTAAFICLLLLLTMSFSKWLILAGFDMNRKYIAEQRCVNRSRPESGCRGKCQLRKALSSEESPAQAPASQQRTRLPEPVAGPVEHCLELPPASPSRACYPPLLISAYPAPHRAIFHPPA